MNPTNISRVMMGSVIIGGLLFYLPVAYFAAAMMIIAGLTGV